MLKYKTLTIIGTSHIAIQSVREVEEILRKIKPEIVALELDKARFIALTSKRQRQKITDIRKIGIKGFLFNLIGAYIEKKLGEIVKVKPGSEMKKAIGISKEINSKIALIDQDISITLKRLSASITWHEKLRFVADITKNIFKKQKLEFDLRKVPDKKLVKRLIDQLKKNYPSLYNVLIKERNEFMAKEIYKIMKTNKSMVAIVGVGHEEAIIQLIKDIERNDKI